MLNCTYQLTVRCLSEHYYDEIKAISSKALANPHVRLRDDFVAQYQELIDSALNNLEQCSIFFKTYHCEFRIKYENKASAEALADIIQNYFKI